MDIAAVQYRFSGYQLPLLQLDETGPAYYVVQPHPYYYNQPEYWQKPYYQGPPLNSRSFYQPNTPLADDNSNSAQKMKLYPIPPLNVK